jgi:hypothetical protein
MSTSSTDRLALRIGALRNARRRRNIRDGAWAAERLRLPGIVLDRSDARFARSAVVRFGHALRVARLRRPFRGQPEFAALRLTPLTLSRAAPLLLVSAATVLAFLIVFFFARPQLGQQDVQGGAAIAGGGSLPNASPLRGRSATDLVLIQVPSPATPAPTGSPAPGAAPSGVGNAGTGTVGAGTATRTAPPPLAAGMMRLSGRVVDRRSGDGIQGVCVVIGATSCARSPITDDLGIWTVDLDPGQQLSWNLKFVKDNFVQQEVNVPSRPGTYTVETISLIAFR